MLRQPHKCHFMPVEYMLLESSMDGKCSLLQKKQHRPTSVHTVQFAKDKSMHCAISERIEILTTAIRNARQPYKFGNKFFLASYARLVVLVQRCFLPLFAYSRKVSKSITNLWGVTEVLNYVC